MEVVWLLLAALLAGFLDSIIGGGGVITLPALLATGMPPHLAVGTNKVVGTGASSIATWIYGRAGLLQDRRVWWLFPAAAVASALGAATILHIDGRFILAGVMAVMVALTVHILARPGFGKTARVGIAWLVLAPLAVLVAFYDGLLGPGTGNMLLFLFVLAGMPLLGAAAHGRLLNLGSNLGALGYFAVVGNIDWRLGLLMAIGTVTGGWFGSRTNIRSGAKWVRPLFVVVAAGLFIRLLLG